MVMIARQLKMLQLLIKPMLKKEQQQLKVKVKVKVKVKEMPNLQLQNEKLLLYHDKFAKQLKKSK